MFGPSCTHRKKIVESLHKKVSAKYCTIFPSVEVNVSFADVIYLHCWNVLYLLKIVHDNQCFWNANVMCVFHFPSLFSVLNHLANRRLSPAFCSPQKIFSIFEMQTAWDLWNVWQLFCSSSMNNDFKISLYVRLWNIMRVETRKLMDIDWFGLCNYQRNIAS